VILSGAGLLACSSYHITKVNSAIQSLDSHVHIDQTVDQLISPYRDTLQNEMGNVVATSPLDMVVGRPSSVLGNWVADALFVNQTKAVRLRQPVMCVLNTGGIRSTINKGDITLGDMYRIMPFDNEVVWLELPATSLAEIESYLRKTTGEPIANAFVKNGKLLVNGWSDTTTSFWVITSDYLANGGDKMTFFSKSRAVNRTGKLLRDVLIEEAIQQQSLVADSSIRIQW
jgi:2',3'-cyclic-nucleotide 2'-phosphodiesterase (5'-nucleotidase family)